MGAASNAGVFVSVGNVCVNVFLGASLKYLWGMVNTMQFVVFFPEWQNLQTPANANYAIKFFRTIALGEFIPWEFIMDPIKEEVYG